MRCPNCSAEIAPGVAFCPTCGASVAQGPPPSPSAAAPAGVCAKCGSPVPPGAGFCPVCGTPSQIATAPPSVASPYGAPGYQAPPGYPPSYPPGYPPPQQTLPEMLDSFGKSVTREPTGLLALAVVFGVCAAVSLILWWPLSIPTMVIRVLTPVVTCTGMAPGSPGMYLCSIMVGLMVMIGPIILMVAVILLRPVINKYVKILGPKIPEGIRFLMAPIIATMIFELAWTGSHINTSFQSGILPQLIFPSVVGIFAFVVDRFGPFFQKSLTSFFDFRDRYPPWLRLAAAIGIPIVISLIITLQERVSFEAFKEQFIVLVSLTVGYLAMAPRKGGLLDEARRMVESRGRGLVR
jgi:hypothetical protein